MVDISIPKYGLETILWKSDENHGGFIYENQWNLVDMVGVTVKSDGFATKYMDSNEDSARANSAPLRLIGSTFAMSRP